jgi:hypothetical protein
VDGEVTAKRPPKWGVSLFVRVGTAVAVHLGGTRNQPGRTEVRTMAKTETITAAVAVDSTASLKAEIDALRAENAALLARKASPSRISAKVSEKGALSVYGLGRFPVTLYAGQWERLIENIAVVKRALVDHGSELARKD